ncbi:vitamin K epoxide reductase family protein [Candidatus Uhrbacteria bacterium]|nr:vitamin K epoxide reductase family protein [Candidatus Uhrbacteria bacterium]
MKPRITLIILAVLGLATMGYLTNLHFAPEANAFCNIGEGYSCDIVNKSEYAKILGIPVSILGLLYFVLVLAVGIFKYTPSALKAVAFLTIAFLGPALYLSYIEFFVLKNICILCEGSKILMLGIVVGSWIALRPLKLGTATITGAVILALILAGATWAMQSRGGPGDKYVGFAQCLTDKGFIMYGSVTCAFCARQRALMGEEVFEKYSIEIECDPRNPGAEVERCIAKNIERTPTWIQEDAQGAELYRFGPGVQSLEKLAEVSDCQLP